MNLQRTSEVLLRTCLPGRLFLSLIAGCALPALLTSTQAQAQEFPVKPIRIIAPYAPGGGTDLLSRFIARKLNESWGQQVLVENRLGAGGIIGTEVVARAAPDGYTLLMTASTHAINPSLFSKLPYDPIKDFASIGMIATGPNIIVVHPSLPAKSVKELIALAKRRPGELTFGSAGVGSTTHLAGEYFKSVAAIDVVHVPFKGSGAAQIDLLGGHIQFMVDSLPSGLPNSKAGKTRALATTGTKRFPTLPEVPTAMESGLPGFESISWWGLMAPAGTPAQVVSRINGETNRLLRLTDVRDFVINLGAEPKPGTPEEFMDYIRAETALYAKVIQKAGIRAE